MEMGVEQEQLIGLFLFLKNWGPCPNVKICHYMFSQNIALNQKLFYPFQSNNQIETITGLEELKALQNLDLSHNQISSLQGLENHDLLEVINLEDNKVGTSGRGFRGFMNIGHIGELAQ